MLDNKGNNAWLVIVNPNAGKGKGKKDWKRIDEDAMVAVVYKVTVTSGKDYVLKICSRLGDYLRETYFLKSFEGKIPVPRIIQLVEPEADIHGAILMECLPGNLLNVADINEKLAYEIGCTLAKIHATKAQGHGDLTQPNQLSVDPRIPFTLKFEEGIDECKDHFSSYPSTPECLPTICEINFRLMLISLSTLHCDLYLEG